MIDDVAQCQPLCIVVSDLVSGVLQPSNSKYLTTSTGIKQLVFSLIYGNYITRNIWLIFPCLIAAATQILMIQALGPVPATFTT